MVDVFISYPQRERALMLPMKLRLEALGIILFVDVDGRLDGEATFPDALDKGVRTAKAVLGCWSPWALTRPWVQTECAIGKDENKLVAVERVALTSKDVPALFYLVDRKPLSDFDGTAPHEGWAMTLSALATKLKLWLDKRPDHPEASAVREKIAVLEEAAVAERAALDARQRTNVTGESPRQAVGSHAAEQAWSAIEQSFEVAHYRRFERTFESDPAAFARVIEAEARAKALERWAATDKHDADAIAETLRTGLFPALQAVAERALTRVQKPEALARQKVEKKRNGGVQQDTAGQTALLQAEGRILVDGAIFAPRESKAVQAGWLKPGAGKFEWFKDVDVGPEMVVVPGNHQLAIGRFAVTFAQWDAAQAHSEWSKYAKLPPRSANDHGWGRGSRPVIDVSWKDAKAYCAWLSALTGKTYRLPSEDEWQHACRAGTGSEYWWGDEISTAQANYNANIGSLKKVEYRQRTVEVDSFAANPWGLYQVHGNVREWCDEAYDEFVRVTLGGGWNSSLWELHSKSRKPEISDRRFDDVGFRVARVLS